MNRSYRTVWNIALNSWIAVPESAQARVKGCGGVVLAIAIAAGGAGLASPAVAACVGDGASPPITCSGNVTGDQLITANGTVINQVAGSTLTAPNGFTVPVGTPLSGIRLNLDGQTTGAGYAISLITSAGQSLNNSFLTLGPNAVLTVVDALGALGPTGPTAFDGNNNIVTFSAGSILNLNSTVDVQISGADNTVIFAGSAFSNGAGTALFRLGGFPAQLQNLNFTLADTARFGNPDFSNTASSGVSFTGGGVLTTDPALGSNVTATIGAGQIYSTTGASVSTIGVYDSRFTHFYGEIGKLWSAGGDARLKSSLQASLGVRLRW